MSKGYCRIADGPTEYAADDVERLGEFIHEPRNPPTAGYTYFGQFVIHDLSFDSISAARKFPTDPIVLSDVTNLRSPLLNLETVYGNHFPCKRVRKRAEMMQSGSDLLFRLDDTSTELLVKKSFKNDLPRKNGKALIVDPRNDENLAVAQIHVAFLKFHNTLAKKLGIDDSSEGLERARKEVTNHYQWIVLHDMLPKLVRSEILEAYLRGKPDRCSDSNADPPQLPIEFTLGVFRTLHSMVRETYHWNALHGSGPNSAGATLFDLFSFTGESEHTQLTSNLPSDWIINWNNFFNTESSSSANELNFAKPIDLNVAKSLTFSDHSGKTVSLSALDILRGQSFGLASGQKVAGQFLPSHQILRSDQIARFLREDLRAPFASETPLVLYLMIEAMIDENGARLGLLGSHIASSVIVRLLRADKDSILNTNFKPDDCLLNGAGEFGMPELLRFVKLENPEYDQFDPIGEYLKNENEKEKSI